MDIWRMPRYFGWNMNCSPQPHTLKVWCLAHGTILIGSGNAKCGAHNRVHRPQGCVFYCYHLLLVPLSLLSRFHIMGNLL